jgi:Esterase PHB depolymerase
MIMRAIHSSRPVIGSALALALLWPMTSKADHDTVPTRPSGPVGKLHTVPRLDKSAITVSGLSSGGFFAHQFHVAFSQLVNGAGIVAGGPFGCVENIRNPYSPFWPVRLDRVSAATVACTHYYGSRYFGLRPSPPRPEDSNALVRTAANKGVIDDPSNLADDRVWLFHGHEDDIVPVTVMETLRDVYGSLGIRAPNLQADWNTPEPPTTEQQPRRRLADHGLPVVRFTGQSAFPVRQCQQHAPPFVIECGFEAAEALLRHLHPGSFRAPSDDPHRDGTLIAFDQTEFFASRDDVIGMHRVGFAYLPKRCSEEECRLHVAFHGCQQDVDSVHDDFIRDGGYNRWAATNNIVVLYPQVSRSAANPNRCWDFWGYTDRSSYYGQSGPQMQAVKAMVDRLLGP